MNEIDLSQANNWFEEARGILEKANDLLKQANQSSNLVIDQINHILATNRYQFLIDSISQQLRLLDLTKNSLLQLVDTFNTEFNLEVRENSAAQLDAILEELKQIHTTNGRTLHDFINAEEIAKTKEDYLRLLKLINGEKSQLGISDFSKSLTQFQEEFSELMDKNSFEMITDSIDPVLEENSEFEQEMAILLESLTKHFDQAKNAVIFFKDPSVHQSSKLELYQVLKNDSMELPSVVEELEEINSQYLLNRDKLNSLVSSFHSDEALLLAFFKKLEAFGLELKTTFTEKYTNTYNQLLDHFDEFTIVNGNLIELAKYYRQFIKSFENLIIEINRRNSVNKQLTKIVRDFENQVKLITTQDNLAREKFLLLNGEYLPKNILEEQNSENSNILYNVLPEIGVNFEPEQMPKI